MQPCQIVRSHAIGTRTVISGIETAVRTVNDIRDADIASEIVTLTKFQVLNQTGLSALAQANAQSQSVLSLIR